ncbi:MFS transporter [Novosphingobium sp. FKTRR1]|uniref:MFS transporter n=1 Tax=Novosphingobium sp. FKTRR1 TaxID=2879118 RepID=UPI001CF07C5D
MPGEALYVLAYIGANISFMPFLVLLLPRRVVALGLPGGGGEHLLSALVLVGGITASLANIAAGHASDRALARTGNRRQAIGAGLACLMASYVLLALAHAPMVLATGVIAFQIAVNLLFAPIGALIADHIPDNRKGRIAGLLNCGQPIASGSVALIAWAAPTDGLSGFVATAALIVGCVLPLLVLWPFGTVERRAIPAGYVPLPASASHPAPLPVRNIALAWGSRFLLQLGAVLLTNYLYSYVAYLLHGAMVMRGFRADAVVGWLSLGAGLAACGGAVVIGHVSDLLADRRKLLIASALTAAAALAGMALAPDWPVLAAGFALFHLSLAAFFSVEAAFVAEMVALSPSRGRLLGIMNLSNTFPAIVTAGLALEATKQTALDAGMPRLLLACAAGCVLAAALAAAIRVASKPSS